MLLLAAACCCLLLLAAAACGSSSSSSSSSFSFSCCCCCCCLCDRCRPWPALSPPAPHDPVSRRPLKASLSPPLQQLVRLCVDRSTPPLVLFTMVSAAPVHALVLAVSQLTFFCAAQLPLTLLRAVKDQSMVSAAQLRHSARPRHASHITHHRRWSSSRAATLTMAPSLPSIIS